LKGILEQLYLPYLRKIGFHEAADSHNHRRCGVYYEADPAFGKGYQWIYPAGNLYAVTVYEMRFFRELTFQYGHPHFLTVGIYNSVAAGFAEGNAASHSENLVGYAGNDGVYQQTIPKDATLRCTAVTLSQKFYKEMLPEKFTKDFMELTNIFSLLNGKNTIPEVSTALRQLNNFRSSKTIAPMYYESKVMEIVSLLSQWGNKKFVVDDHPRIPKWKLERMQELALYLEQNFNKPISFKALSKVAYMSRNRLADCFKSVYGLSIFEYLQTLRVNKAKELLLNSDLDIGKIACAVGYNLHSSFSEMFKKSTGTSPNKFRADLILPI
jgi:AraC-like DNA-binding protein